MVLLDDMAKVSDPMPTYNSSGSNLLKKFDIPIHHLDFGYVNDCRDANQLEKILQILKSGEEGYYPELTERTEQRLMELKPSSKYIRKTVRVLNRKDINKENYEEISDDLTKWLNDINRKNEELEAVRNKTNKDLPQVRQCKQVHADENKNRVSNRIRSTDYAAWDKYDPETEILKMDLEDKKAREEAQKLEKQQNKKSSVTFNPFITATEAVFEAQRENEKGNEYFKAKDYEISVEHYSNSILYRHNVTTFKNRASAYMAIKKYELAITDYKEAIKFDENDFESLFRTAQCYHHLQKYDEARFFMEKAIFVNPNDSNIQKLAENIRKYTKEDPIERSKVRLKISNVSEGTERRNGREAKKSILKKDEKVIIPIPGTSKMPGPYYKVVNSSDIVGKKVHIPNNSKLKKKKMVEFNLNKTENNNPPKKIIDKPKLNTNNERYEGPRKDIPERINEISELDSRVEKVQTKIIELKNDTFVKPNLSNDNEQEPKRFQHSLQINEISEVKDLKAAGEPCTNINHDIAAEEVHLPYSFIQTWLSARKENNYTGFAKIIRNMDMQRLPEVMGNKLDATMLKEILNCLYRHFTVAHEVEKVYNILISLPSVSRFSIIIMFLSNEDKTLLQNLINFLKQHGKHIPNDILCQFNLH